MIKLGGAFAYGIKHAAPRNQFASGIKLHLDPTTRKVW